MFPIMEVQPTALQILWYILVIVLWVGFFFLEGFDFGVAMALPILGKNDKDRRLMINSIGPVWDGNEVWLLTAGGATFAAFPGWYATLFSALYLPLLLVLLGLILRGVAFEYRGKRDDPRWRAAFDWCATIGSFLPSLVLGVGFANFVIGLPTKDMLYSGTFLGLFINSFPYGLIGGIAFVLLFLLHGMIFLSLKVRGELRDRAQAFAGKFGWATVAVMAIFMIWMQFFKSAIPSVAGWVLAVVTLIALAAGVYLISARKELMAFIAVALSIIGMVVSIMWRIYPTLGFVNEGGKELNAATAGSSEMTLTIMTVAACIFVPIVLAYQAWTYWVFRKRLSAEELPEYNPFKKKGERAVASAAK